MGSVRGRKWGRGGEGVAQCTWGRKDSNTLMRSKIGDHVWLMMSRHTEPPASSTLGWYILFPNPMEGDL